MGRRRLDETLGRCVESSKRNSQQIEGGFDLLTGEQYLDARLAFSTPLLAANPHG